MTCHFRCSVIMSYAESESVAFAGKVILFLTDGAPSRSSPSQILALVERLVEQQNNQVLILTYGLDYEGGTRVEYPTHNAMFLSEKSTSDSLIHIIAVIINCTCMFIKG